jgi:hypothetical protein
VIDRRVAQADAGAVDEDIDPAAVLHDRTEGPFERGLFGHIGGMDGDRRPVSGDRLRRRLGHLGVAVEDRDGGARRGQGRHGGAADPARTAGHDGDFAIEAQRVERASGGSHGASP